MQLVGMVKRNSVTWSLHLWMWMWMWGGCGCAGISFFSVPFQLVTGSLLVMGGGRYTILCYRYAFCRVHESKNVLQIFTGVYGGSTRIHTVSTGHRSASGWLGYYLLVVLLQVGATSLWRVAALAVTCRGPAGHGRIAGGCTNWGLLSRPSEFCHAHS